MTTAVPKSLNLGSVKPTTIPAYSRRVESIATNAQEFTESGIANIVLDTSTPGSFLDPQQSLLQFDIAITNTNPYIDYINLSSCGIGSIIQEMRIICQGTPIEEILDYNLMFEMFMDLGGHAQEEFKMYLENSWRAPVLPGLSDLNFVKPPMVDREGVIMCPTLVNQFGDSNLGCIHNEDGQQTIDFYDLANPSGLTNPWSGIGFAPCRGLGINGNVERDDTYTTKTVGNGFTLNATDGSAFSQRAPGTAISTVTGAYNDKGANAGTCGNYIHLYEPGVNRCTLSTAPGNIRTQTWTDRLDNTYVTWPSTIRPEPWQKSEARQRNESDARQYRIQDYMEFLANVKNIPVGIQPAKSFIANDDAMNRAYTTGSGANAVLKNGGETKLANWNFATVSNHLNGTTVPTTVNYSISLPIFSGIIGLWAEKQFPTMLISPGSFYIQIKFAKAAQAFQAAMDPCRRVFGTYRDYVCNAGLPTFYKTEYRGQNLTSARTATVTADQNLALTTAGTLGWDFAWQGILGLAPPQAAAATTLDLGVKLATAGNGFRNNIYSNVIDTDIASGGTSSATTISAATSSTVQYNLGAARLGTGTTYCSNHVGQGEGYTTGHAKPQYVPRKTPWLSGGHAFKNGWADMTAKTVSTADGTVAGTGGSSLNGNPYNSSNTSSDVAFVLEKYVCFGTYLPASTAQVRRTTQTTCLGITNPSGGDTGLNNKLAYTVRNLKYVGIQTILPDEVTASIVRTAASSDISLHAQSVRTYRTLMAQSLNQNLILPVKVASANSMWVVFQNQKMIEDTNYCSCTRTCPFTSLTWTRDSKFSVGSNTAPKVQGVSTASNAFSIQLRIGNELLPIQPINNIQQVMIELVRSIHGMSDMNTNLPMFGTIKSKIAAEAANDGSTYSSTSRTATNFTMLKNNDFCTPFVPWQALDDQTITNNPAFLDYLQYGNVVSTAGTGVSTHTALGGPASGQFNDRGIYTLPMFLPPISKFLLGFDLDTFPGTNDSARSGRYLGNAPLTLQMTNTYQAQNPSLSGDNPDTIIATAIVLHDIRFSIMAGGQVLSYY
jgi:hypothetical protein